MAAQWPLIIFSLLAGTGSGLLAFAGASGFLGFGRRLRLVASVVALALLVLGGIASMFHLAQPVNVMSAAGRLFSGSPISVELLTLIIAIIVALAYLLVLRRAAGYERALGLIAAIAALPLAFAVGHGYEVVAARPAWNVAALPWAYLFNGVTLGGFVFLLLEGLLEGGNAAVGASVPNAGGSAAGAAAGKDPAPEEPGPEDAGLGNPAAPASAGAAGVADSGERAGAPGFGKLAVVLSICAGAAAVAYAAYGLSVQLDASAGLFWGVVVLLGGAAVLVTAALLTTRPQPYLVYGGLALALIGGIAFRVIMWQLGDAAFPAAFDVTNTARGLFPMP